MTAFTTERWAEQMLFTLKESTGGFAARIVNHNFHNPGGDKADAVKIIKPDLSVVGTATTAGMTMPSGYDNANSTTITLNLDTPIRYAVGLPWEMQLKTYHDIEKGYRLACEDIVVQQRNTAVMAAINAESTIPVIGGGTAASPVYLNVDNVLSYLTKFRIQLMKTGAIMEYGKYRFVDEETQDNVSELSGEQTAFDGEGGEVPGVLGVQVREALPVLGVPGDLYELIIEADTKAGSRTEAREFYGNVPVIRGFEIVLDESLDHMSDASNKHLQIICGTRNLVTEAFTQSRAEVIPDPDKYRDILRGMIVYGAKVTNPLCGARGYFTLTAPSEG